MSQRKLSAIVDGDIHMQSRTFRAPVEELELWRKLSEKRWVNEVMSKVHHIACCMMCPALHKLSIAAAHFHVRHAQRLFVFVCTHALFMCSCTYRWPLGDVTIYKGNWRAYFASRMALPASLPSNIDQAVLLTQQASQSVAGQVMTASVQQGQVRDLFARFMQAVLSVGLLLEVAPAARKSKEVSVRFNAAVCNWLEAQPQVAISYVQDMVQTLQQQGPRCMGEAAWRRSALAFLMRAAQHAAHASILSRLQVSSQIF